MNHISFLIEHEIFKLAVWSKSDPVPEAKGGKSENCQTFSETPEMMPGRQEPINRTQTKICINFDRPSSIPVVEFVRVQ